MFQKQKKPSIPFCRLVTQPLRSIWRILKISWRRNLSRREIRDFLVDLYACDSEQTPEPQSAELENTYHGFDEIDIKMAKTRTTGKFRRRKIMAPLGAKTPT